MTDGENFLRDKHNHLIVDHDLFNHDGLTHDGIAEAFIEFAKKENLSFFDCGSFDEEKYKNLSEELEVTEIFLSEILKDNVEFRIDSEYYKKEYVIIYEKLKHCDLLEKISEMHDVSSNGSFEKVHQILNDEEEKIIPYIRSGNVGETFINHGDLICISKKAHEQLKLSQTKLNDVMMARKGKIGGASIITENEVNFNCNENVIKLTIINWNDYNPYYLTTFFNSKFGRKQIERLSTGNVQQWVSIFQLKKLKCYKCSKEFQEKISELVKLAHEKLQQAQEKYKLAEKILSAELGLENFKPSTENIAVKNFSASFLSSGRLDAEFYQPKYDDLKNFLKKFQTVKLGDIVKIFKSIEPGSEFYSNEGVPFVRVSDVTKFEIVEPEIKLSMQVDEKLFPHENTILFSKDGTVGIAYKVRKNLNAVTSGALLHLTIIDKNFLPDFLTLILNSKIVQMQAERDTNGAIIQHWKISDIEKILIPKISVEVQEKISAQIEESFKLRAESKRLLEDAKKLVELEIEKV